MSASEHLARRFLHVNLNCRSLDAAEGLYAKQLGLSARMRTDPDAASDGAVLGFEGEVYGATTFLYDARGGRNACSLESIEWRTPAMKADDNTDPVRPGIRSAFFTVNGLGETVTRLRDIGLTVGVPVAGLMSGAKSVLAIDGDGVVIELTEVPSELPGALFAGIRIAAVNASATVEFLTAIGFMVLQEPTVTQISGDQLAPGGGGDEAECVVARLALPEDQNKFTVVVVQHPDTGKYPLPEGGSSQGLYRCATRVENMDKALSQVPDSIGRRGPIWCPLPGTPIEGLNVAFLTSPDGVVFEFVERPLSFFTR
ncbi:glyoxalase/bleomycin resistance/dioxygenase family protein [Mycobacterium sp. UM_CSW]|uniref:VOC family protein n=1 Tax=Mycobacterium sp. UM_CSW TaxID=1370119 RepID=UPI00041E67A7|nr:glyoxalase/bleomycin resistance/dioxygenase family protein [Mycobacterium sp. UM_CSW]